MSTNSRDGLLAVGCSLMGLSVIAIGLRFYARKRQAVPYQMDDWLVLPALVTYIGVVACTIIAVHAKALGYSSTSLSISELPAILALSDLLGIATGLLSNASLTCVKLSAVFFYRRVFCVGGPTQVFSILTMVTVILLVAWLIALEIMTGLQCGTDIASSWDGNYVKYCGHSFPFLLGTTISDFLFDLWILLLPIPSIANLHTSVMRKVSIIGVMLLACVFVTSLSRGIMLIDDSGLGASIARMVVLIQQDMQGAAYFISHDQELSESTYVFLISLENGIALVAVNLPSLWLLCTSVAPSKVIRSIRSILSLASLRSHQSSYPDSNVANVGLPKESTSGSMNPSNMSDVLTTDAHRLRDDLETQHWQANVTHLSEGETQQITPPVPFGAIHVQDTIELK